MPAACVVFDLDGVIVDSEPIHERANDEYATSIGTRLDAELLDAMMGRRVRDLTDELARLAGVDPTEAFAAREAVFWRLLDEGIEPMAGLHQAVERLAGAGLRLGVASSGTRPYVEWVLDRLGVRGAFQAVVSGDDVRQAKPHPEVYLLAAERLGTTPDRCVAIEDTPHGIAAARAAGMRVIAVPHPLVAGLDLTGAHVLVKDLAGAVDEILG